MKINYHRSLQILSKLFFFLACQNSLAQTVPVGLPGMDEALRQLQLQGKLDIKYSLAARPFFTDKQMDTDSIYRLIDIHSQYHSLRKKVSKDIGALEVLPLTIGVQYNSDHPYGWNHAGMIQAKGLQTFVSTGVFFSAGPLSIQLKPEYVTAGNPEFAHNGLYGAPTTGSYSHLFAGQSSIRLNAGPVSVGISTENLWWGPGISNSLLMSNNAPGFGHLTFNTRRPVKTPVGNFEWQVVMGKLVEDPGVLLENKNLTTTYYNPNTYGGDGYSGPYDYRQKWRYLSGLTLSYNPKWIPGLFIGLNRVAYTYKNNLDSNATGYDFFHKYFPTLFGAFRQNYAYGSDFSNHAISYKQIVSVNLRWVFQQSHAEVYAEYGVHDNAYNTRDFILSPEHAAAYTLGIKKLKPLGNNQWLDINAELTQLAQSIDYLLRNSGNWYAYQGGYTNQNRIIGAGFGMGSNMQTLKLTHINGFNKLGLTLQAIQHDPTALAGGLGTFGLRETHWNDFTFGFQGQHSFKKILLSGELQFVNSKNYAWEDGANRFNLYGLVNLSYFW